MDSLFSFLSEDAIKREVICCLAPSIRRCNSNTKGFIIYKLWILNCFCFLSRREESKLYFLAEWPCHYLEGLHGCGIQIEKEISSTFWTLLTHIIDHVGEISDNNNNREVIIVTKYQYLNYLQFDWSLKFKQLCLLSMDCFSFSLRVSDLETLSRLKSFWKIIENLSNLFPTFTEPALSVTYSTEKEKSKVLIFDQSFDWLNYYLQRKAKVYEFTRNFIEIIFYRGLKYFI